jgi:DNA-binding NtrC family response regulator
MTSAANGERSVDATMATPETQGVLRILWVDDDEELTSQLSLFLNGEGYQIDTADTLDRARTRLADQAYDLVLIDLYLPDGSGLSLIRETARSQAREFVVLTGHGDVKTAIEALRHQVFDYLIKPVELTELRSMLARVRNSRASARARAPDVAERPPRPDTRDADAADLLIGKSPALQAVQRLIDRVARSDVTVLVQGATGTGKEVVARALHRLSSRSTKPFLAINCAAVSPSLIASELFGHEKGSFTGAHRTRRGVFERAEGGTIFLDEVTEMPLDLQGNLLRVLETGTVVRVGGDDELRVNVRVIAATNRDPMQHVRQGRFRLDLYYRLQVFPIALPPLRERGDDVLTLAQHFLTQLRSTPDTGVPRPVGFSPQAFISLLNHDWPGNVREMRNVIERACLLNPETIEPEHLFLPEPPDGPAAAAEPDWSAPPSPVGERPAREVPASPATLRDAEEQLIRQALAAHGGNKTRAAAQLGISVKTLYNKLKRMS